MYINAWGAVYIHSVCYTSVLGYIVIFKLSATGVIYLHYGLFKFY
jgi:hypothetical protein